MNVSFQIIIQIISTNLLWVKLQFQKCVYMNFLSLVMYMYHCVTYLQ